MGRQLNQIQEAIGGKQTGSKTKIKAVVKAKKTLMRLKSIFTRESNIRHNNLNATNSKNLENVLGFESKCTGEKLTEIENLLHSETMLISQSQKAEARGKVELFRRFMRDVNESMNETIEPVNLENTTTQHANSDVTTFCGDNNRFCNVTSRLNLAFIGKRDDRSLLNNAMIYSTSCLGGDFSCVDNITGANLDYTDVLNECIVYEDSENGSETSSESAFEDDDEVCELEMNIFDEDFDDTHEVTRSDVKHLFTQGRSESTEDAIDSFMNTVNQARDEDEGLSSLGSDSL